MNAPMRKLAICLALLAGAPGARAVDESNLAENLVRWSGYAVVASVVFDAFAPNWELQEAHFPGNHYHLFMQMKRTHSGGAGEARVVFQRRAKELMRAGGFDGYEVLEYSEGMESSVLGSRRNATGVIKLTRSR